MAKQFKGRPVLPGEARGEAAVSRVGFNTLAVYHQSIILRSKKAICADHDNPDLYKRDLTGKLLCLPQTIGPTTGGMALQTAASLDFGPRAMLFSEHIDSLAAAGVILADIWLKKRIVVVDQLGADFLDIVQTGQTIQVHEDGTVVIEE